nr:diaminopimelate epimerase [Lachnospiraceae bacterium]
MKFTKMQGCGNDYVYVDGAAEHIKNKEQLVLAASDRHFGIGSDGVIFINPSEIADFEMEMYNADASRAEMCGNGMRCVGKFVYDHGLTDKTKVAVESFGKIKYLDLTVEDGKVSKVRVNMGEPELTASAVPVVSKNEQAIDEEIEVNGKMYRMTCVSMGNPHAVVFMDHVADMKIEEIGPFFEHHERFPKRTNTEFVKVIDDSHVEMRVWERGSGETLACGTGCCATAVACALNGYTGNHVFVKVLGGEIEIEWDRENNLIYMTGPATTVYEGDYPWTE